MHTNLEYSSEAPEREFYKSIRLERLPATTSEVETME